MNRPRRGNEASRMTLLSIIGKKCITLFETLTVENERRQRKSKTKVARVFSLGRCIGRKIERSVTLEKTS